MRVWHLLPWAILAAPAFPQSDQPDKSPPAFEFHTNQRVKISIDKREIKAPFGTATDPRDKIPPIYKPKIVRTKQADTWLDGSERVLGVVIDGHARAYPLFILAVHEMCNDTLGGRPIAPNY